MKKVVVIGAGAAGIEASSNLAAMGYSVTLLEKEAEIGGHLLKWDRLFPSQRPASEVLDFLNKGVNKHKVDIVCNAEIVDIIKQNNSFSVVLKDNKNFYADALLVASGFDLFNARIKEEYGYGIYDNVITSVDLEAIFLKGEQITTANGGIPRRIGFIHCVGSRDEKVGNTYCSQVCCVTAVKQAIEIKEKLPKTEVFCFYIDMRMFGLQFEELYKESQEKWGINYIRGRLSEANENIDGTIVIKVEDTLAGRPLKMRADLLVLMIGIVPSEGTVKIGKMLDIDFTQDGFIKPIDEHTCTNISSLTGVFMAGTCLNPKTFPDTFADARAAALKIADYLQ